ncbi:MAG: carbohydrate kinase family protein [Ruminococcus sp.]|nr:carbohydrate kinase family protein [Ruminococcus sp.]
MSKILVCGLVNMETSAPVEEFPITYRPVDYKFFGINTSPGGVGYNVSLALKTLGDDVSLCSLCGNDAPAQIIKSELSSRGIPVNYVLAQNKATAQSVVLFDATGKRYIITDLADNQEQSYDVQSFKEALKDCDIACLCNINYAAALIPAAKEAGVPIATDVHCLWDVYDEYNSRFMKAADILFLSNENIIGKEEEFIRELAGAYSAKIIVVGMGDKGAMLYTRETESLTLVPAVYTRPVVNTVGAGDSLYSAFVHFFAKTHDALRSLQYAVCFASYKIGENGASKGFISEEELLKLMEK